MKVFMAAALIAAAAAGPTAIAMAQDAYKPGDKVEVLSPFSGSWVKGTITRLDGKMGDGRTRYIFQADDHSLANDFWGTTAEAIRPGGAQGNAAAAAQPAPAVAAARAQAQQPAVQAAAPPAAPGLPPTVCGGGGGAGTVKIAGAQPAPLGKGIFPNGQKLGTPGQTNYLVNNGQKSIVAVAPPGMGNPIGQFNLMVGGTWSTASIKDLGGGVVERTLEWNVPTQANVLAINSDHTWYRKSGSQKFFGRWIDLGQNVVQLIGYDGDDWTGSIQRGNDGTCRMEMRGPLGQNEWGKRL